MRAALRATDLVPLFSSWASARSRHWKISSANGDGCGRNSAAQTSPKGTGLSRTCQENARRMLYAATAWPASTALMLEVVKYA